MRGIALAILFVAWCFFMGKAAFDPKNSEQMRGAARTITIAFAAVTLACVVMGW